MRFSRSTPRSSLGCQAVGPDAEGEGLYDDFSEPETDFDVDLGDPPTTRAPHREPLAAGASQGDLGIDTSSMRDLMTKIEVVVPCFSTSADITSHHFQRHPTVHQARPLSQREEAQEEREAREAREDRRTDGVRVGMTSVQAVAEVRKMQVVGAACAVGLHGGEGGWRLILTCSFRNTRLWASNKSSIIDVTSRRTSEGGSLVPKYPESSRSKSAGRGQEECQQGQSQQGALLCHFSIDDEVVARDGSTAAEVGGGKDEGAGPASPRNSMVDKQPGSRGGKTTLSPRLVTASAFAARDVPVRGGPPIKVAGRTLGGHVRHVLATTTADPRLSTEEEGINPSLPMPPSARWQVNMDTANVQRFPTVYVLCTTTAMCHDSDSGERTCRNTGERRE
ncbi:hypothetical protein CBR_g24405 [Chara braunii]|uniref:Uncharacterized protein n=1 Tax=Chara braunii TaxID=69332 RepID=A0A388JML2_CHABU|nr:hypothetical protein CBR_g24405 [Chara braunii]|eukprot:GBG59059.1 hypothetical protein CBR_g24405 [Chara braunii]